MMGINLFRRKPAAKMADIREKVASSSPAHPAATPASRYYLVNIAPLLAELATRRIREQRARDFARCGIWYGKPLEERLKQEELLRQKILQGERENETII
ncbi:hypothetical protein AGMMS50268_01920 [Spirochaetia bacterium]|nr:hypothetical protein AGMMS50268_01920 [Spirochaetia bacterium]